MENWNRLDDPASAKAGTRRAHFRPAPFDQVSVTPADRATDRTRLAILTDFFANRAG